MSTRIPNFVAANNTIGGYVRHPTHSGVRPGDYTDDTQMTLAVAELLVAGEPWTPPRLAAKFVEVFHRDQRAGYASGFYTLLTEVHTSEELLARLRPHSTKSGAAMRAGPVSEASAWIQRRLSTDWATPWRGKVGVTGEECVRAAASRSGQIAHDLPEVLVENLENGPYGRDYLAALDTELFAGR